MNRFALCILAVLGLALAPSVASAIMSDYAFTASTGKPTDMSKATQVMAPNQDETRVGPLSLGISFVFDGVAYTDYNISANGFLKFGTATTSADLSNAFDASAQYPLIAPFWDDLRTYPDSSAGNGNVGYVEHLVEGTAPNRVVTIEFLMKYWTGNGNGPWKYQLRLYETSNKIEILFISMPSNYSTTATIGMATSTSNFASVTPGSPATVSYTVGNHSVNLNNTPIPDNTLYTFVQCESTVQIAGSTTEGGTVAMKDGDTLLVDRAGAIGEGLGFRPFTVTNGSKAKSACNPRNVTFAISGPSAGEYALSPTKALLQDQGSVSPLITFTPAGLGLREATLTVTDDNGFSRSYLLAGVGVPRIAFIGNTSEGGTANVADGDRFLAGVEVRRNTSKTFRPLTILNNGKSTTAPAARVTYTIDDPTGQYTIAPAQTDLRAQESSTPAITFAPTMAGLQRATLVVNADGEVRSYPLEAYSLAPAAEFTFDNIRVAASGTNFLNRTVPCVGEIVSIPVTITNVNRLDFVIDRVDILRVDESIGAGNGRALMLDGSGRTVPSTDYVFSAMSSSNGRMPAGLSGPTTVRPNETRTFWVTFSPSRPGPRYARLLISSNGENFVGQGLVASGPALEQREGAFAFEFFGKGSAAVLSGNGPDGRPAPIAFATTDLRTVRTASTVVRNDGTCDLVIDRSSLRITAGDVEEFSIVSAMTGTPVVGGSWVLAPGRSDSIVVAFRPLAYGSRRASLTVRTNDSILEGATSTRGDRIIDLFGRGNVGLDVSDVTLSPAVAGAELGSGRLVVTNTRPAILEIVSATIIDAGGEIREAGWPSFPRKIGPGENLDLPILLVADDAAATGVREVTVRFITSDGDTTMARVRGVVGRREVAQTATVLFEGRSVAVGSEARRTFGITNVGTVPVRIGTPTITGADASLYRVVSSGRRTIEPGATELFEVTFAPTALGGTDATMEITTNATSGPVTVRLAGAGAPVSGTIGSPSVPSNRTEAPSTGTSTGSALHLGAVSPNPARGEIRIVRIDVPTGTSARLALVNASGRIVYETEVTGSGPFEIPAADLSAGSYRLLLRSGEQNVTTAVRLLR